MTAGTLHIGWGDNVGSIQSADGQWWQYVPDNRGVNCKAFGAKPDANDAGSGGPWTGTDNTPFIQAALNFAMRARHKALAHDHPNRGGSRCGGRAQRRQDRGADGLKPLYRIQPGHPLALLALTH
jgi:hypothetical protein